MEYLRALSVHFAALLLLFTGAAGLLTAAFGNISVERDTVFLSIVSETRSRKLNGLLGAACVAAGGGMFWLALREFRPPSYALLLISSLAFVVVIMLVLKAVLRSAEALDSVMAKGVFFLVNALLLGLVLLAVFYLGEYFWRVFVAGR